jgi:NTP pyrophosphatase (non-canonical NTP hydrolase)
MVEKLNDKTAEALVILQEECAEVIQEVSKCFRFGIDNLNKNGVLHSTTLNMEVGDMLALVDILISQGVLDRDVLELAKESKIEKLKKWSKLYE